MTDGLWWAGEGQGEYFVYPNGSVLRSCMLSNNSMQRTALRAAADAGR